MSWKEQGGTLQPIPIELRPRPFDPLPFSPPPPALDAQADSGVARTVVEVKDGWLVAMDRGEFGAGLYGVKAATREVQQLDANLLYHVGWVGAFEFGVVGVAGLCHGATCTQRTSAYEVFHAPDEGWRLLPIAVFAGCPSAVGAGAQGRSLLVAAGCGGLSRIERESARTVATWPDYLQPWQVTSVRHAADAEELYYVSFGRVLARFGQNRAEWFAPLDCATVATGPNAECSCVPGEGG